MATKKLTEEDVATIRKALAAVSTIREAQQLLNDRGTPFGYGTVQKVSKLPVSGPIGGEHRKPDFGAAPANRVDVLDVLAKAAARAEDHNGENKDYRRIVIETDVPIAVMKSADWHFGGLDISYESLAAHIQFLWRVPGMYLQLFGDDLNLMVMHKTVSARHDILTPDEQIDWLESFVDECLERGKLISMGWGNHSDEFTERSAGFGIVKRITKAKIPYLRGLGYIDLVLRNSLGEEYVYPMAFAHKVRFNSFMNALHGNKRMQQMHAEFFGVTRALAHEYITAHTHNPEYSTQGCIPEQRVHLIRCGTFKTNCLYSQRYFGQGRIGVPTVVYHADRFEHTVLPTPWEAYRYMTGKDWQE